MPPPAPANPQRGTTFVPGESANEVCGMSQGATQMISNEIVNDDIGILASQPSASRKKANRAANYSVDEDIQLCESWLNISLDPITGNEQPGKAYWTRIHDNFHANKDFVSDRNANSLEHRWATIHKECQKFQGLFEEVGRRHPSGVPYQEHLGEAQKAYAGGKKKQGFPFLHCWLKIRHSEKFVSPVNNKRPRDNNSPPGTVDVFDVEDDESTKSQTPDSAMPSSKRPMGRRQAKAKEKLKNGGEPTDYNLIEKFLQDREKVREDRWQENKELHERKLLLEERKFANEEKKTLWEQEKEKRQIDHEEKKMLWEQEQQIMFCDLTTLDSSQKTYVIAMRATIAAEKMAAFNKTLGGGSGGHEASGGEI